MTRKLVKLLLCDYNKDHVLNWTEQLYASPGALQYTSGEVLIAALEQILFKILRLPRTDQISCTCPQQVESIALVKASR